VRSAIAVGAVVLVFATACSRGDAENTAVIASERERQGKAGIQPIDFGADESKKFLEKAIEVAWQSVIKRAPETGAKLRQLAGN